MCHHIDALADLLKIVNIDSIKSDHYSIRLADTGIEIHLYCPLCHDGIFIDYMKKSDI